MEQTGGGDDSLLQAPRVDVAMKVYQGGGLDGDQEIITQEKDGEIKYKGVTGMVQRHQVSLYKTPSHKVQLKVYMGGGRSSERFRGEEINVFQENKQFYTLLLATGEYYLKKVIAELSVSTTPKTPVKESQGKPELKGVKGELKGTLDKFGVFFYGENTSDFHEDYKTQLLIFSTVMGKHDPKSPGTLGICILTVDDGWTISLPSAFIDPPTTIRIGPYMMRDPTNLTADTFFEDLMHSKDTHAKSERLYMREVIFGGYPLSLLKKVLLEKKGEFFDKVWKPLIDYNINDNITFQLSSPLEGARNFLSELHNDQVREIGERADQYIQSQGFSDTEEGQEREWVKDDGEEGGVGDEEGGKGEGDEEGGKGEGDKKEGTQGEGEEGEEDEEDEEYEEEDEAEEEKEEPKKRKPTKPLTLAKASKPLTLTTPAKPLTLTKQSKPLTLTTPTKQSEVSVNPTSSLTGKGGQPIIEYKVLKHDECKMPTNTKKGTRINLLINIYNAILPFGTLTFTRRGPIYTEKIKEAIRQTFIKISEILNLTNVTSMLNGQDIKYIEEVKTLIGKINSSNFKDIPLLYTIYSLFHTILNYICKEINLLPKSPQTRKKKGGNRSIRRTRKFT
jgi:hypothetical protein